MTPRRRVALVVVTFNSASLLADLVASLPIGCGTEVEWELIVADNASTDDTVARLHELAPACRLVEMGRNAGYAAGINAGVRAAGDRDAYLILNPDVRLTAGCVPALLEALERPGAGIAVPRLDDAQGRLILSMRREPSVLRAIGDMVLGTDRAGRVSVFGEMVSNPDRYTEAQVTDWAEGSTQLISRACWQTCGPWSEAFFLYSEETEFDLRAGDSGFTTWYEPAARAVHLEGGSSTSTTLWALLQVNRVRMFALRHGRPALVAFWGVTLLREASRSLLGRQHSRAALRALLDVRRLREQPGPHSVASPKGSLVRKGRQPDER